MKGELFLLITVMDPQPVRLDAPPLNVRTLYLAEYEKLVELPVFDDQAVALIEGQVVVMSPQGDAHDTIVRRLQATLIRALPRGVEVNAHSGFPIQSRSKPEPDITVFPGQPRFHQASGVLLVIEVSVSSLHNDRNIEDERSTPVPTHPTYWIVDVADDKVIVHDDVRTLDGYDENRDVRARDHADSGFRD